MNKETRTATFEQSRMADLQCSVAIGDRWEPGKMRTHGALADRWFDAGGIAIRQP